MNLLLILWLFSLSLSSSSIFAICLIARPETHSFWLLFQIVREKGMLAIHNQTCFHKKKFHLKNHKDNKANMWRDCVCSSVILFLIVFNISKRYQFSSSELRCACLSVHDERKGKETTQKWYHHKNWLTIKKFGAHTRCETKFYSVRWKKGEAEKRKKNDVENKWNAPPFTAYIHLIK